MKWTLITQLLGQGDQNFFIPAGSDIEVQIQDLTGVPGIYSVSNRFPWEMHASLADWTLTGMMFFTPAWGQMGYDLDVQYHPLAANEDGDTADGLYVVDIYEPSYCAPDGCYPIHD